MDGHFQTQSVNGSAAPMLVPRGQHAGQSVMPMGREFTLIGCRNSANLRLLSPTICRTHAVVINDRGRFYIRDTASRGHLYVNGALVRETDLNHGDVVVVGAFTLELNDPADSPVSSRIRRPEPAALMVTGEPFPTRFSGRTLVIGRLRGCDVVLTDPESADVHAVIFELGGEHHIRDLGLTSGTFVNGEPIRKKALEFGDRIRIDDTEMKYIPAPTNIHDRLAWPANLGNVDIQSVESEIKSQELATVLAEEALLDQQEGRRGIMDNSDGAPAGWIDMSPLKLDALPDTVDRIEDVWDVVEDR